ncbi:MAG: GspH/FimT family pseudopilin, partial [Deltaproteobacteria bacterium]|jgi:Tfp pilus assembly protein FimT|nr:GspH/FimT family pseudopilin [Deltaproteobacteria bacterium]
MNHQGITKSTRGFIMKTVLRRGYLCRKLGFTTIELIVTVGVMAALAAASVPIFRNFSPSYNSKHAARNIVSQMQLARVHAIRNRVTAVAVFYPKTFMPADQANSFLIYEDADNDWIQDPGETVILSRTKMPAKVNLQSATFTDNGSGELTQTTSCGFDSQGIAARNGAVYVIGDLKLQNDNNQERTITFHASGKTKISLP